MLTTHESRPMYFATHSECVIVRDSGGVCDESSGDEEKHCIIPAVKNVPSTFGSQGGVVDGIRSLGPLEFDRFLFDLSPDRR